MLIYNTPLPPSFTDFRLVLPIWLVKALPHMDSGIHPYEQHLTLFGTGLVLGIWLVISHIWMLRKSGQAQAILKSFPRHAFSGKIILAVGMLWFWLLIAPPGYGVFSSLAMDLGDFNNWKWLLRLLVPISYVLVITQVEDFLSVRALGVLGLMAATPLLSAAFLKDPATRLLLPIFAYALIIASLYCVGMPYLFRDAVTWATQKQSRWVGLCSAGAIYGVLVLTCAFAFWRGY